MVGRSSVRAARFVSLILASLGVVGLALLSPLLPGGIAQAGRLYSAELDGAHMVPPVDTGATGHLDLYLEDGEQFIWVDLRVYDLENQMTASHIHLGPPDQNGPQIFNIGVFADSAKMEFPIQPSTVTALKQGNLYVAVHTAPYPVGEIRGQIFAQPCRSFIAHMDGAHEVPSTNSQSTGLCDLTLWGDHSRIHVIVKLTNWTSFMTACHIHKGQPGQIGPHIFDLGTFDDMHVLSVYPTEAQIADLIADGWYINVHSGIHPTGEIRGQFSGNTPASVPVTLVEAMELRAAPNPSNGATRLAFQLPEAHALQVSLHDASGRAIRSWTTEELPAGEISLAWDGRDDAGRAVAAGIYFARVSAGSYVGSTAVQILR